MYKISDNMIVANTILKTLDEKQYHLLLNCSSTIPAGQIKEHDALELLETMPFKQASVAKAKDI